MYGTNILQHNRYRLHRPHKVVLARHYPDKRDYHHRTDTYRTGFPKISNTIHLWCPPLARGWHSSHYDCHYYYQQCCHVEGESSGLLKRFHDYVQYTPTE